MADPTTPLHSPEPSGIPSPLVSIVIVTFNRPHEIVRAVESALSLDYPRFEVIVVDNGSPPGPEAVLSERFGSHSTFHYVRNSTNLGAAGGRNVGVDRANGEIIIFLDDDARFIRRDTITYAVDFLERHPDAGALQFDIVAPDGELIYTRRGPWCDPSDPHLSQTNYLLTGGLAVRRSTHELIGGFPDNYMFAYEDNHYGVSMILRGLKLYRTSAIAVEHPKPEEQGSRRRPIQFRLMARNVQWLFFEFYPLREAIPFVVRFQLGHLKEAVMNRAFLGWLRGSLEGILGIITPLRQKPKLTPAQIKYIHSLDRHGETLYKLP